MLSAKYMHKISYRRLKLPINSEHNSPAVFAESRNHSEVLEVNNPNYERQSAGILCKKVDSFFPPTLDSLGCYKATCFHLVCL